MILIDLGYIICLTHLSFLLISTAEEYRPSLFVKKITVCPILINKTYESNKIFDSVYLLTLEYM